MGYIIELSSIINIIYPKAPIIGIILGDGYITKHVPPKIEGKGFTGKNSR
jgi:hypothetical protein